MAATALTKQPGARTARQRSGLKAGTVSKVGARRVVEAVHADGGALRLEMQVGGEFIVDLE